MTGVSIDFSLPLLAGARTGLHTVAAMSHRLVVASRHTDPRSTATTRAAAALGYHGVSIEVADLFVTDEPIGEALRSLLIDPLIQVEDDTPAGEAGHTVDVLPRDGVTDRAAAELQRAGRWVGQQVNGHCGRRYLVHGVASGADLDPLVRRLLANPVVERWTLNEPAGLSADLGVGPRSEVDRVTVTTLTDDELARLSAARGLSLDLGQMQAVAQHFREMGREPTDAELEMIAQTWSEHCAHTTFRSTIRLPDGALITPLLTQLRLTTEQINRPWVINAFTGNAGIVSFTEERTIALKAETHNHPSAIEPFGGANTGVGGVIRDVMGAAHRPIAVTDILCFGPPDQGETPDGVLHPLRIADGVIAGVADYGNKIGLPTVAGAVVYDPGYTANPLVYAGCIGVASTLDPPLTGPHPGDRVVVIGGRTGRDGIRGATFSSRTMDGATGEVAGASVQIGDPITEKLLIDVLDEATGLYTAITDCGAGGLSSAVGEMAETLGCVVDLAGTPLKYPGLAPWEIWLSEAQERMVLAVDPSRLGDLAAVCDRHGVEFTDLGQFSGDGRLVVRHGERVVVDLDTEFLHHGQPRVILRAEWPNPPRAAAGGDQAGDPAGGDPASTLLALLAHPNIASKADVIHRYDHEVRGATALRPLVGPLVDGHGDGVALVEPTHHHGIAIGIGVNPWYGVVDPERMAHAVVDEAIRNVVAIGADPDKVALLDNFSWGDPQRPSTLGDLAAAVRGCCAAAVDHDAPFVSGKDSLNNEYTGTDGQRHSVPPTLVITAVAHVPNADRLLSADLKQPGNYLVLIGGQIDAGAHRAWFGGSHLAMVRGLADHSAEVPPPDRAAPARYRVLHHLIGAGHLVSCHDVSEGGLAVAVAEMAMGGRLGAHLDELTAGEWFGEANGRFVAEIDAHHLDTVQRALAHQTRVIGVVSASPTLRIGATEIPLDDLLTAWQPSR